ncbi:hypothetical protein SGFS_009850 [Streptomyces graminofaciens]|uniref:Uncharacterized protein n=1 Tax=Streptomyces graminofaciens TaxID=68212 RepID=A0ABM7F270_9ACTN|nr:hypothetical protein SGFS_009850 [Streptomyces graminofaciens]
MIVNKPHRVPGLRGRQGRRAVERVSAVVSGAAEGVTKGFAFGADMRRSTVEGSSPTPTRNGLADVRLRGLSDGLRPQSG